MLSLEELELAVGPVFESMQSHGLYFDFMRWKHELLQIKLDMSLAKNKTRALLSQPRHLDLFGESDLNLDSPAEVNKALLELKNPEEALGVLKTYRECAKLVQTYGDSFLEHVNLKTSRIYTTFDSQGTSTGRVSSHNPNIQNLPSDKRFQACLVAPPGKKLVQADYAACELRILADFSGEPVFLKAFEEDLDLHAQVALELFGDIKYRDKAKAINFGLVYGMGPKSLAQSLAVSQQEAEKLLAKYFQKHAFIKRYLESCVQSAYTKGYAETRLGRKLYLDVAQDISRVAKNMPIQGTAAEMIKLAMIRIHERLAEFQDAFLVNMIHDELVAECLEQDAEAVALILKQEMESAQRELTPRVKPKAVI
ncbi:MAG: DNA polymerase A family protein [Myxococcaceae bacterium]